MRSLKAIITDPTDLRSQQLFGKPALIFFVILPHLLNWLRITLPDVPSLLYVLHSLAPMVLLRFLFSVWPDFVWGICFFGLWHAKPWAWRLAVGLDSVIAASYLYQAALHRIGVQGPWFPGLSPGNGAGPMLGFAGLVLILQPVARRYFFGQETGLEGLPGINDLRPTKPKGIAGQAVSVVRAFSDCLVSHESFIVRVDKAMIGLIAACQMILCFGYLVVFFIWAFALPLFGGFLLCGIISGVYLGSRLFATRLFALIWGLISYGLGFRQLLDGSWSTHDLKGFSYYIFWFSTVALLYQILSLLLFHAGYGLMKRRSGTGSEAGVLPG